MNNYNPRPGDIAACFGTDAVSRVISLGTASLIAPARLRIAPSHVAIMCDWHDDIYWVESTTLSTHPCAIRREPVSGVQAHFPAERITDYTQPGGRVDLYRLTEIDTLSTAESTLLSTILIQHFLLSATTYDTPGALLSGTRFLKYVRLFTSDFHQLFCSELIAAVLQRLGRMNRANPTRFSPATLLRSLVRQGTYGLHQTLGSRNGKKPLHANAA